MKNKLFVFLTLVLSAFGIAYGAGESLNTRQSAYRPTLDMAPGRIGYVVVAGDTATTAVWALVTREGWTHPSSADTLRIRSSSTADSSHITIWGILAKHNTGRDSVKTNETLRLSGTDTVYSSKRWRWLEYVAVDTTIAGTLTLNLKGQAAITTIPAAKFQTETAHFFGRPGPGSGFLGWTVSAGPLPEKVARDTSYVQLRMYARPDTGNLSASASMVNLPEKSHILLDECTVIPGIQPPYSYRPSYPIFVPSGAYVAAFSRGSSTNADLVNVKLEFYDK